MKSKIVIGKSYCFETAHGTFMGLKKIEGNYLNDVIQCKLDTYKSKYLNGDEILDTSNLQFFKIEKSFIYNFTDQNLMQ